MFLVKICSNNLLSLPVSPSIRMRNFFKCSTVARHDQEDVIQSIHNKFPACLKIPGLTCRNSSTL